MTQRFHLNVYAKGNWKHISSKNLVKNGHQFSSVQLLSCVQLFATPWTAARQASLSITNSWSLLKLMSITLVMPSNQLILCRPLLLLPSIFPSIRVFSNESVLCIRWPKYWSFSFSISPSNEHSGLNFFRIDWLDLLSVQETSPESSPASQFKRISFLVLSCMDTALPLWFPCTLPKPLWIAPLLSPPLII